MTKKHIFRFSFVLHTHTIPFRSLNHSRCCYTIAVPCVLQFHIRSYIFLIIFFFLIFLHTHSFFFPSIHSSFSICYLSSILIYYLIFFHSHIFFSYISFSKTCTKFLLHVPFRIPLCSISCSCVLSRVPRPMI